MKKLTSFLLCTLLCISLSALTVSASEETLTKIELLEDGSYIETIITENSDVSLFSSSSTRTGSKTSTHKDSSGKVLWSIKVSGTFTYNGKTSQCTKSTISTTCPSSSWKLSNKTAKKSKNTATASATAKRYVGTKCVQTINRSVTLTCSSTGKLS